MYIELDALSCRFAIGSITYAMNLYARDKSVLLLAFNTVQKTLFFMAAKM